MNYKIGQFVRREHPSNGFFVIGKIMTIKENGDMNIKKYFQYNPIYKNNPCTIFKSSEKKYFGIDKDYKDGITFLLEGINNSNIKQYILMEAI